MTLRDIKYFLKLLDQKIKYGLNLDSSILEEFEKNNKEGTAPVLPKGHLDTCLNCNGSGLLDAALQPSLNQDLHLF